MTPGVLRFTILLYLLRFITLHPVPTAFFVQVLLHLLLFITLYLLLFFLLFLLLFITRVLLYLLRCSLVGLARPCQYSRFFFFLETHERR